MKELRRKAATLAAVALFLAFSMVLASPQSSTSSRMIFAVWPAQKGKQPDAPILDPIAILDGSLLFKEPLKYDNDKPKEAEAAYDAFVKSYFQSDQRYPLLFGGSELGTISVGEATGISCESLTATAKPSVPVPNGQRALATTSLQGLGLHDNWRQMPTPEQQSAFLKESAEFLTHHGLIGVLPTAIKLRNLRLTRLGKGQPEALVGSVTYKEKLAAHNLFLVAVQRDLQWEVALSSYHVTKNLADYTDDIWEDLVDQLDLDNDGVDEIVTISWYYESWNYTIYKETKGKWEKVYQGGGGGC